MQWVLLITLIAFLPDVTIASIPVIGGTMVSLLGMIATYWNGFIVTVPYMQTPTDVFFGVIIWFEIGLFSVKLLLGSHNPIR